MAVGFTGIRPPFYEFLLNPRFMELLCFSFKLVPRFLEGEMLRTGNSRKLSLILKERLVVNDEVLQDYGDLCLFFKEFSAMEAISIMLGNSSIDI